MASIYTQATAHAQPRPQAARDAAGSPISPHSPAPLCIDITMTQQVLIEKPHGTELKCKSSARSYNLQYHNMNPLYINSNGAWLLSSVLTKLYILCTQHVGVLLSSTTGPESSKIPSSARYCGYYSVCCQ